MPFLDERMQITVESQCEAGRRHWESASELRQYAERHRLLLTDESVPSSSSYDRLAGHLLERIAELADHLDDAGDRHVLMALGYDAAEQIGVDSVPQVAGLWQI